MLTILIVSLLAPPNARAVTQDNACSALTAPEIAAATGEESKASAPLNMDDGKGHRQLGCQWTLPSMRGGVTLGVATAPAGANIRQLIESNPGIDALKAQHYSVERQEIPNVLCLALSPPSTVKNGLFLSTCGMTVKDKVVSIAVMSQTTKLPLEKTKALLSKAAARQR